MPGKDALQGTHQVAQKSITIVFPLKSLNFTILPVPSFIVQSGIDLLIIIDFNSSNSLLANSGFLSPDT
jgi:hypothetical protein